LFWTPYWLVNFKPTCYLLLLYKSYWNFVLNLTKTQWRSRWFYISTYKAFLSTFFMHMSKFASIINWILGRLFFFCILYHAFGQTYTLFDWWGLVYFSDIFTLIISIRLCHLVLQLHPMVLHETTLFQKYLPIVVIMW
jgi:hypothetical protein